MRIVAVLSSCPHRMNDRCRGSHLAWILVRHVDCGLRTTHPVPWRIISKIDERQALHYRAKASSRARRLGVAPRIGETISSIGWQRMLGTFLHDVLESTGDEVQAQAERLEHCISNRLAKAIAVYLVEPQCDPNADPIPTKLASIPFVKPG